MEILTRDLIFSNLDDLILLLEQNFYSTTALTQHLTMCSSMEPIIEKIYSNETKVPCSRRVPWQFHQVEIVINEHINNKFSTQHNYPIKIKKVIK